KDDGDSFHNFAKFTEPIVKALNSVGVPAELIGRNDLLIEGKKFSGNAQFLTRGRMFSHGTLMFDSEIEHVVSALSVSKAKIESNTTKTSRSRMTSIIDHVEERSTIEQFKELILCSIFGVDDVANVPRYDLTEADWDSVYKISEERYQKWEWTYGRSPAYNVK